MRISKILEPKLIASYLREIEQYVAEAQYTDALKKLHDFAQDFAPVHRSDVILINSRYANYEKGDLRGQEPKERFERIGNDILKLAGIISRDAKISEIYKFTSDKNEESVAEELKEQITNLDSDQSVNPSQRGVLSLEYMKRLYVKTWRESLNDHQKTIFIDAQGISKLYGPNSDDFVLRAMSLQLAAGEITGVVGMNASGKTTLLRLLRGEIARDSGTLTYPAISSDHKNWPKIRSQIAYVRQLPPSWQGQLRHHLSHLAAAHGVFGKDNQGLVDAHLMRYGLDRYKHFTCDSISGGYKIRIELVRALLMRPSVLMLDEPLAYLDVVTQQLFLSDLRAIASNLERPTAVIITSQNLFDIENMSDKVVVIDNGVCLFSDLVTNLPRSHDYWIWEIGVDATEEDFYEVLRSLKVADIERTATSYIVFFSRELSRESIMKTLQERFGARLNFFRDISGSTRSLFRNQQRVSSNGAVR